MAVTVRHPAWFGAVIRHAIALRGFGTQHDLAQASGLSLNSIGNILTGARDGYRQATFNHLATGLRIPRRQLVALACSRRRGDPFAAAQELLARTAVEGQATFTVDVEGADVSLVEAALAAALASLEATQPGLSTRLHLAD